MVKAQYTVVNTVLKDSLIEVSINILENRNVYDEYKSV